MSDQNVNPIEVLDSVAGASNDIFRLVGSPLQEEARAASAAVRELVRVARIADMYVGNEAPPEFAEEYAAALAAFKEVQC